MRSHYPKILLKMNTCLHTLLTYFENVVHPAGVKRESQKSKIKSSKNLWQLQASPDCLNRRASVSKQDNVRRNPAP